MKRYMLKFNFWLNMNKQDEYQIAEEIEILKQERTFSKTIRDGIRLIRDLRRGNIDVLLELFPWAKDKIALEVNTEQPETIPATAILQEQLNRMEQLLLEQGALPINDGIRPMQTPIPRLTEPVSIDDIQFDLKKASKDENKNSTWNFMISMALQSAGNANGLPPECIDYGLRTGQLTPDMIRSESPRTRSSNPKAMDVPQFEAPDIDLDDLDFSLPDTG